MSRFVQSLRSWVLASWLPLACCGQSATHYYHGVESEPMATAPLLIPYLVDTLYGYATRDGQLLIPAQFDGPVFFDRIGIARVGRAGRRDFIDRQGNSVLPPDVLYPSLEAVYNLSGETTSEGRTMNRRRGEVVDQLLCSKSATEEYFYSKKEQRVVAKFKVPPVDASSLHGYMPVLPARFRNGVAIGQQLTGNYVAIDTTGRVLVESPHALRFLDAKTIVYTDDAGVTKRYEVGSFGTKTLLRRRLDERLGDRHYTVCAGLGAYPGSRGQKVRPLPDGTGLRVALSGCRAFQIVDLDGKLIVPDTFSGVDLLEDQLVHVRKGWVESQLLDLKTGTYLYPQFANFYPLLPGYVAASSGRHAYQLRNYRGQLVDTTVYASLQPHEGDWIVFKTGEVMGVLDGTLNVVLSGPYQRIRYLPAIGQFQVGKAGKVALFSVQGVPNALGWVDDISINHADTAGGGLAYARVLDGARRGIYRIDEETWLMKPDSGAIYQDKIGEDKVWVRRQGVGETFYKLDGTPLDVASLSAKSLLRVRQLGRAPSPQVIVGVDGNEVGYRAAYIEMRHFDEQRRTLCLLHDTGRVSSVVYDWDRRIWRAGFRADSLLRWDYATGNVFVRDAEGYALVDPLGTCLRRFSSMGYLEVLKHLYIVHVPDAGEAVVLNKGGRLVHSDTFNEVRSNNADKLLAVGTNTGGRRTEVRDLCFRNRPDTVTVDERLFGVLDERGEWLIPKRYNRRPLLEYRHLMLGHVEPDGTCRTAIYDQRGRLLLRTDYCEVRMVETADFVGYNVERTDFWGRIDTLGRVVLPLRFHSMPVEVGAGWYRALDQYDRPLLVNAAGQEIFLADRGRDRTVTLGFTPTDGTALVAIRKKGAAHLSVIDAKGEEHYRIEGASSLRPLQPGTFNWGSPVDYAYPRSMESAASATTAWLIARSPAGAKGRSWLVDARTGVAYRQPATPGRE